MEAPSGDEIHVWHVDLARRPGVAPGLSDVLAADEAARATRFLQRADYERFVVGRAALRHILGRYLDLSPHEVPVELDAQGKPRLTPGQLGCRLCFNLSHSGAHILIGVTDEHDIGVDVEWMRPELDIGPIAQRFFSPAEAAEVMGLPEGQRRAAFYRCWTRKEAYLKARGTGLALGLDRFEVSLLPGVPAALRRHQDDPGAEVSWRLYEPHLPTGYAGAVAVAGHEHRLAEFDWSPPFQAG